MSVRPRPVALLPAALAAALLLSAAPAARACSVCNAMVRDYTTFALPPPLSSATPPLIVAPSLPSSTLTSGGTTTNLNGFNIQINAGTALAGNAAALAAFERAAARWEQYIADPITVTIAANLGTFANPNTIGSASSITLFASFNAMRNALVTASATESDDAIVASLPTAATFSANLPANRSLSGNLAASKANLKAVGGFGDLDAQYGATDATITFNQAFSFDYDNSDGVGAGRVDFETVAAHELGHALGFFSAVDNIDGGATSVSPTLLDLFRFSGTTGPTTAVQFSSAARELRPGFDAVLSDAANSFRMSTGVTQGDGRQASHWKDDALTGLNVGIMDPTLSNQTVTPIRYSDLRALDLIGYQINSTSIVPEASSLALIGSLAPVALPVAAAARRRGRRRRGNGGTA